MAAQITCSSCQTKLSLPNDIGPDSKVKCPKCGKVLVIPKKKILSPPDSQPALAVEERPALSRNDSDTPILAYALPTGAILVALLSLALPILIGQYALGLIVACLAAMGSVIGVVLLLLKKWKGMVVHLAGAAICATAVFVCIHAILLQGSVEKNGELLVKNERAEAHAKADLEESKKKLAEAEDAPRKAEEILKKAEEAPKKAEAFYEVAKAVQDKTDAAEKRTADLLAKVEELERKTALDRKKIMEDRAKIELSEKNLKVVQKDIDDKRQELVTLKKEIETDKKAAADELATLKKEIAADRKKADEKQREIEDVLKKIERTLKGAALKLQDKNPQVRLKTVKDMAKLPVFPEAKEFLGEAICMAMLAPLPAVRNAAAEALEKIDPTVHPHMVTLVLGQNKVLAIQDLGALGKKARSALPVLIYYHQTGKANEFMLGATFMLFLEPLTKIAPDDKRVSQLVLNEVLKKNGPRFWALRLLDKVEVDNQAKLDVLLIALNDGESAVEVIAEIEKIIQS